MDPSSPEPPARGTRAPEAVLAVVVLALAVSLALFALVDLWNLLGIRDRIVSGSQQVDLFRHRPFFFLHWWREGGPVEVLQWVLLGSAAAVSGAVAARAAVRDRTAFAFWRLMAVTFVLMMVEDAGNARHTLREYVQAVFWQPDYATLGTLTELAYFTVLGSIPLYALLRYGRRLAGPAKGRLYLAVGFVVYGLAVGLSFVGSAFTHQLERPLYGWLGTGLFRVLAAAGDDELAPLWLAAEEESGWESVRFFVMDSLVEESLELVGAGAFLASALVFLHHFRSAGSPRREP